MPSVSHLWSRARIDPVDGILVLALVGVSALVLPLDQVVVGVDALVSDPRDGLGWFALSLAQSVPLLWRRSRPVGATTAVLALTVIRFVTASPPTPADLSIVFAMYGVGAYARSAATRCAACAAGLALVVIAEIVGDVNPGTADAASVALVGSAFVVGPWAIGWVQAERRRSRSEVAPDLPTERDADEAGGPESDAAEPASGTSSRTVELHEPAGLTAREREVFDLVARGLTNPQIARELFISTETAKWHVGNLLRKLGVSQRHELIALAHRRGAAPMGTTTLPE
ncbi:MAG: helix-turn-helix domain-containing protein [Dermatophilaceae bacterium]